MLTIEAIKSAAPLAEDMVNRGFTIIPVENSPLAALVKESIPGVSTNIIGHVPNIDSSCDNVHHYSNLEQPGTGIKPHDMVMDEIVPVIASAVKNHIAHARGIVVPLVEDMVNQVKENLVALTPSSLLGLEVIVFNPPAPFTNTVFENSIGKFANAVYDASYTLPFTLPEVTIEELDKIIKTNSNELDKDVSEWLISKNEDFMMSVWVNFFMGKTTLNLHSFINDNPSGFGRSNINIEKLIAIYLIARNLFDTPPNNTFVSLEKFNEVISTVRDIAGSRLYFENMDYYEEIGKRKILVRSIANNKIIVNGPVYKEWIKNGGENEVLFGNSLIKNPVRDIDSINERKVALITEWNRHSALITSTEAIQKFARIKQILLSVFRKQIVEANDPELNKEAAIKTFEEQLDYIRESGMECIYSLSLKLICRSRFANTDAENILLSINRISKDNPKLDIREVATIAVIEYIATWVTSQLRVV